MGGPESGSHCVQVLSFSSNEARSQDDSVLCCLGWRRGEIPSVVKSCLVDHKSSHCVQVWSFSSNEARSQDDSVLCCLGWRRGEIPSVVKSCLVDHKSRSQSLLLCFVFSDNDATRPWNRC